MKRFKVRFLELHEVTVDAQDETEAYDLATSLADATSLLSTTSQGTQQIGEECDSHGFEVSDDNPCEECAREAHEEHESEISRGK